MSPFEIGLAVAGVVCLAGLVRAGLVLANIGSDSHAFGPWDRPEPKQPSSRLPADFIALWSLFGERSMQDYAGSWEAAVMRLDRLEAHLQEFSQDQRQSDLTAGPAPERYSATWLARRVDELVALAGMDESTWPEATMPSADGRPGPESEAATAPRALTSRTP